MGHFWHTITASSARTPLPMLGPRARAFSCVQYVRYVYVYYVGMGKGGIGWIKDTPAVTQSPKESRLERTSQQEVVYGIDDLYAKQQQQFVP